MEKKKLTIIHDVSIFDGCHIKSNKTVLIANRKILDIQSKNHTNINNSKYESVKTIHGKGNLLIPGFIDIQVNGGGGALFNREPTAKGLKQIFQAHLKYGTTSIFPTFISDSFSKFKKCLLVAEKFCSDPNSGILGFHVEGPFINTEKRGIHPQQNIILHSNEWLSLLLKSKIKNLIVTLAPEMVEPDFIKKLAKKGIHVFAGHTNASAQIMAQSFSCGVSGTTHLFNACSQMTARDVGVVGASLLKNNILCSLILDNLHIADDALKIAFAVKNPKNFILISDAMESVGTNIKKFKFFEEHIHVNQNELKNSNGVLAGAHLTMLWAFQNLMKKNLVTLEEAISMTSTNQANFFKIKHKGAVIPGYDADLVLLKKDTFNLLKVFF